MNKKCLQKHICTKFPRCELLDIPPVKSYKDYCEYFKPNYETFKQKVH